MMADKKPVVIIGAGIGGLSAAIRLAAAGLPVIVLEKNAYVGGKMGEVRDNDYRWDTGPSVITMRHVFEDLFSSVGRNIQDYIQLEAVNPLTRYFYPDGTVLDAYADPARMTQAISEFAPDDVDGYKAYLEYVRQIYQITAPVFIHDHPPTFSSLLRVPITQWLRADPLRTMHGAIKRFVRSDHLQQLLGRFATYVGGNPYAAPATLNVIAHVELNEGVWYPRGGVYEIAEALLKLAQELGVEVRLNHAVDAIDVLNNRVAGVVLSDSSILSTDRIISNVDVTTTFRHLLPQTRRVTKRLEQLTKSPASCSGFVMLLGIAGKHDQLAHHNIFFSEDYRSEFDAIFKDQLPAEHPTIYVAITSKTDPQHAPADGENWFVLVNAPALSDKLDWKTEAIAYRNRILELLAERGFDIRNKIQVEHILTPADLQRMSGAWRGALYGPSPNNRFIAFRRPHNRSNIFEGLYFAGGTTHPGGGVPMVTLSGKVAAEMLINDMMKSESDFRYNADG